MLTADWEQRLGEVERGKLSPKDFLAGIVALVQNLVDAYQPVPGAEVLFSSKWGAVGRCPRCGGVVAENAKGFCCENRDCGFALWKNSRFFTAKKKKLTKEIATALLSGKRLKLTGCVSEKTGRTYSDFVTLEDDGEKTAYRLEFTGKR